MAPKWADALHKCIEFCSHDRSLMHHQQSRPWSWALSIMRTHSMPSMHLPPIAKTSAWDLKCTGDCDICTGLGATLLLLAIQRHALPALPFSIALGVVFYFAARWALEPFLLPLTTQLLYF